MQTLTKTLTLALAALVTLAPLAPAHPLSPELEQSIRERFEALTAQHGDHYEALDPDDYRHPFERRVVTELMKNPEIQAMLPEAMKVAADINQQYHRQHLLNGVLVSETQFPEIHQMALENAAALRMKTGFKIYVMNSAQMNAYTWSIDQENYGVALYSGIIKALTPAELRYVLAHEMGHVKSRHILNSVLLQMYFEKHQDLPPELATYAGKKKAEAEAQEKKERPAEAMVAGMVDLPVSMARGITQAVAGRLRPLMITGDQETALKLLQQAAEYSSDRAGMVAAADRETGMLGLVKLASGQVGELGGFDLDAYVAQVEAVLESMSDADLEAMVSGEGDHAFTLMRVAEVGRFHDSDAYQNAARTAEASVFVRVVSATLQVATKLLAAQEQLEEFNEDPQAKEELNALVRRRREKVLTEAVARYAAPEEALRSLTVDACAEFGLARSDEGPFDLFAEYALARRSGEPFGGVVEALRAKIQFLLQGDELEPDQRVELERKLKVLEAIETVEDQGGEDDDAGE